MVYILCALVDGITEQGSAPVAFFLIEAGEVILFGNASCGVAVVVVCAYEQFEVLAAVAHRVVIEVFACHDDITELAKDRFGLIGHGLVEHVVKFTLVAEAHTSDANLGQQVVFTDFAPTVVTIVVPVAVERCIIEVGGDVVVFLVATSAGYIAV